MACTNLSEMAAVLNRHGSVYTGGHAAEMAQDWLDNDFTPAQADEWCEAGFWAPDVAAQVRDAGVTPDQAVAASASLTEAIGEDEDAGEVYTDGDPIYAVCNNDTAVSVLIDAVEA